MKRPFAEVREQVIREITVAPGWNKDDATALVDELLERHGKIGVLAIETGDYTAYVAYFDDPDKLRAAVERLNAERMDNNTGDNADAEVHVEEIRVVPDTIDDDFLDLLAALLNDSAYAEIEDSKDRAERLAEEAAEAAADEIPFKPSPGQEEIGL